MWLWSSSGAAGMASDWTGVNPQLAQGEAGVELDTWKWKMGDGKKRWIELPYMTGDGGPIPDEVWVGPQDPSQIQPAAATELWYDTLGPPPVLKVKLPTGEWRPIGGEEVFIGTTNPGPTYELWYDTTTSPGILKARRGTAWEPIGGAGHDEVWTGPSTPNPAVPYEIWYDTSTSPGRLYARAPSGEWVSVVSSEVSVKDTDPYAAGPDSSQAELWFDETTSILYARVNDTWVPASSTSDARDEVLVSPSQPRDVTTELWYDTSTTPGVLKAHLPDGSWENTAAAPSGPGIDEVWVGQNPPDPVGTYELWFDISNPPVLKAKMPTGAWVPTTKQEVVVGPADPDLDIATPGVELWYDTTTGVLKARKGLGWENVSTAGGGEEVAIGPDDPAVKDPKIELWFDPTARPAGAPTAPKLDWTFVTYSVEATPGTPPAGGREVQHRHPRGCPRDHDHVRCPRRPVRLLRGVRGDRRRARPAGADRPVRRMVALHRHQRPGPHRRGVPVLHDRDHPGVVERHAANLPGQPVHVLDGPGPRGPRRHQPHRHTRRRCAESARERRVAGRVRQRRHRHPRRGSHRPHPAARPDHRTLV